MCQNNNNTKSRKGKHLEYIERQSIERWYNRERKSKAEIARLLERDEKTIDVPAKIVGNRTLVPLRAISEALNSDVEWYPDSKTILINDTL